MSNDIAIGVGNFVPTGAQILKKPVYLIILTPTGPKAPQQRFISLDKPRAENGVVEVKGIFSEKSEDEIIENFQSILTTAPKELILEMMFPLHRVISIRSLVFNAVKNVSVSLK